jgi:S-adenosylmethionine:diacylglycerol 3-amino-3-carboxypropyl transferase
MYEDVEVELAAFRPGGRIFSIASAGCTAMRLAERHEVLAVDINPTQLDYAARRLRGEPPVIGTAEGIMAWGRTLAPLVGWTQARVSEFLDQEDTAAQLELWQRTLNTWRFRSVFDGLLSLTALRRFYQPALLSFLPPRLGAVFRRRMERCFGRHPNRDNPYARALFLGEPTNAKPPANPGAIQLVHGEAAAWLEQAPAGSFDGFTLSNILDGTGPDYRARLLAAVQRAAAPGAVVVVRSFAEPEELTETNRAADDRAMLWGIVDVRPAEELEAVAIRS